MSAVTTNPVNSPPPAAGAAGPPYRAPWRPRRASGEELIRKGTGTALTVLSTCLLSFVLWVTVVSPLHFHHAQRIAYEALRVQIAAGTAPNSPGSPSDPNSPVGPSNPVKLLALGSPVAVLKIPAIGLSDVVLEGTTGGVLENGPGHLRDTPLPGQEGISVIMGRRAAFGGAFSHLSALNPGDAITVDTGQVASTYRVLGVRRAGDPIPPPLTAGQGRLTLVTADGQPFTPTGVLYVDAELMSKAQPTPAPMITPSELPASENVMGTDPGAWLKIFLWGQVLLLAVLALSWLRHAWGRWQTWTVAVPVLVFVMLSLSDQITRLLPNLM